jgi:hypothetical protein
MSADVREHIRRLVADAPRLTPDQLDRLAVLLRPALLSANLSVNLSVNVMDSQPAPAEGAIGAKPPALT